MHLKRECFTNSTSVMMTLFIAIMLLLAYAFIATAHLTYVNKAAIAMFSCTLGWVIYLCFGTDFVTSQHLHDYREFLSAVQPTSVTVKYFIYDNVFLKHVGRAASVVLFLLATMQIIEILNNNGCFDFVSEWIRTRNSKRILWSLTFITFLISANLDNLTTTAMMLMVMHRIVQNRRQRMLIGTAIVVAANAGGCFTVIGDPATVALWGDGAVTATHFSAYLAGPALVAWGVTTALIGRGLPDRLDVEWQAAPYRGDDTNLNRWQRMVMLIVGIGGLWFIPTFHNITKLSPFLGALCVLSILWVVNEVFNRKLMAADQMFQSRVPRSLQYETIQQILYVMGIMLTIGVVKETGLFGEVSEWMDYNIHNVWVYGLISGIASGLVDSFTIAMTQISMYSVVEGNIDRWVDSSYMAQFMQNGTYWKTIVFSTSIGGCLLGYANVSGLALMKMERMRVGWYFKNCTRKVMAGWLLGLGVLFAECYFIPS